MTPVFASMSTINITRRWWMSAPERRRPSAMCWFSLAPFPTTVLSSGPTCFRGARAGSPAAERPFQSPGAPTARTALCGCKPPTVSPWCWAGATAISPSPKPAPPSPVSKHDPLSAACYQAADRAYLSSWTKEIWEKNTFWQFLHFTNDRGYSIINPCENIESIPIYS